MVDSRMDNEQVPLHKPTGIRPAPLPCALVAFESDQGRAGCCYLPDGQYQQIEGPSQLRNDILWLSNLPALEPLTHLYPNLRSRVYLNRRPEDICRDLAITNPLEPAPGIEETANCAARLSSVFTRVTTIAARAYGWDVYEMGPLRVREPLLMRDIEASLPTIASVEPELQRALVQAYQGFSAPDTTQYYWSPNHISITLRFNELRYINQLLSAPVPCKGKWIKVQGQAWNQSEVLDYCLARPTVVRASIDWSNTSEQESVLAAFGMSGQAKGSQRRWLTQPELAWISKLARIEIHQFWVFEGNLQPLSDEWQLPELLKDRPQAALSYSAGLVAHNHFLALTEQKWDRDNKIMSATAPATWLRALDRAMMYQIAYKAEKKGFTVQRYGLGSLQVRIHPDQIAQLEAFRQENGFLYPDLKWIQDQHALNQAPAPGAVKKKAGWHPL
ncbi:hypothetical protein [Neopusillimonas maritima]|nr:hypothetical protein [Neopusillimonas maritima]